MTDTTLAGVDVSRETFDRLTALTALLQKWNPAINLVAKSTIAMQQSNMIAARDRDDLRSVAPQHLTLHFQQRADFEKLCLRADQSHTSGHCKRQDHRHGLRCFQRFACHQELSAGNWNI